MPDASPGLPARTFHRGALAAGGGHGGLPYRLSRTASLACGSRRGPLAPSPRRLPVPTSPPFRRSPPSPSAVAAAPRSATAPPLRRRCFAGSRALLAGSGILLAGSGRHRCGGREGREQLPLRAAPPPPPQVPEEGREEAGRVEAAGAVSARGRSGSAPERVCRLRLRAPRRRASLGPCSSPRAAPESG